MPGFSMVFPLLIMHKEGLLSLKNLIGRL